MNVQNYINMATALIMFVGGMMIVFFYPGILENRFRVLIGLFVTFYFIFRMGTTIMAIRRRRREDRGELAGLINDNDRAEEEPKSP